jgi:5-methyltetrahydropteroyltriglutamate--homocysteine methyltransferase
VKRSTDRFLTTHMGGLSRPDDLAAMLTAKDAGQPYDAEALAKRVTSAVADVVREQVANGIDIVNDGEYSKFSWGAYFGDRLNGIERKAVTPNVTPISARDMRVFPAWFALAGSGGTRGLLARMGTRSGQEQQQQPLAARRAFCVGPLTYAGAADTQTDIANLKAAAQGQNITELYLTALAPATAEYFITNEYYETPEELVFAIAEAMHEEYKAITDAGIVLQLDEPAFITMWQTMPDADLATYRRWLEVRIEALNNALKGIPEEMVRLHMCWGSSHHPHSQDIPLGQVLDLLLTVKAGAYSLEAANPQHDGDWRYWRDVKFPDGKIVIPGVIGHFTDFIENSLLVADRYLKYANIAGKENVIGGTDCGIGTRVGTPEIGWAKFRAMRDGAKVASDEAWRRN